MDKYIYHHLGLGDHIICNGAVRYLTDNDHIYGIFCKEHNEKSVSFMFRDLNNVNIIPVKDDSAVGTYFSIHNIDEANIIKMGYFAEGWDKNKSFAKNFYDQLNIPFNLMWNAFYVKRDIEREINVFNHFNVVKNEYIFLHEDVSRGFQVILDMIDMNFKIVSPEIGLTDNIFDYCMLIENAHEVHGFPSSFIHLTDQMGLNDNLFVHDYARGEVAVLQELGKKQYRSTTTVLS